MEWHHFEASSMLLLFSNYYPRNIPPVLMHPHNSPWYCSCIQFHTSVPCYWCVGCCCYCFRNEIKKLMLIHNHIMLALFCIIVFMAALWTCFWPCDSFFMSVLCEPSCDALTAIILTSVLVMVALTSQRWFRIIFVILLVS